MSCSCLQTASHVPGPSPESNRPRCLRSNDRGSPQSRCPGTYPRSVPTKPPIRHPGGWWAHPTRACLVWRAAADTRPPGAAHHRRVLRHSLPTVAGAMHRPPLPRCDPAPSHRPRQSCPEARLVQPTAHSWPHRPWSRQTPLRSDRIGSAAIEYRPHLPSPHREPSRSPEGLALGADSRCGYWVVVWPHRQTRYQRPP